MARDARVHLHPVQDGVTASRCQAPVLIHTGHSSLRCSFLWCQSHSFLECQISASGSKETSAQERKSSSERESRVESRIDGEGGREREREASDVEEGVRIRMEEEG